MPDKFCDTPVANSTGQTAEPVALTVVPITAPVIISTDAPTERLWTQFVAGQRQSQVQPTQTDTQTDAQKNVIERTKYDNSMPFYSGSY